MKCPQCKNDFKAGVKAAYKLGVLEGENRLETTINCIKATNRRLFNELLWLDKVSPRDDCCIKISRQEVEHIIRLLKKYKYYKVAIKLQKMIKEQISTEITLD